MKDTKTSIMPYFVVVVCSILIALISFLYFSNGRFSITSHSGNHTYKIDSWTGRTWLLINGSEIKLSKSKENQREADMEKAINLAKYSHEMDDFDEINRLPNIFIIRSTLEVLKGPLVITGWLANEMEEDVYLVRYLYTHNEKDISYNFEVNISEEIVRYINKDPYLLQFYRNYIPEYSSLNFLFDEIIRLNLISQMPSFSDFKIRITEDEDFRRRFHERLKDTDLYIPSDYELFNTLYIEANQ